MKVKLNTAGFRPQKYTNKKRLHEGFLHMCQALEKDEYEARNKKSGLPSDWRSRVIKF